MLDWRRPKNLGARDGRLAPPRRTPNCVSSQADPGDAEHYIAPIRASIEAARRAIESLRAAKIITCEGNYLYAEFRSRLFGFVDDLELLFDGSVLQVRSASRLGRRDFGVNRKRVEALRSKLEKR